jgi:hypothetical protein
MKKLFFGLLLIPAFSFAQITKSVPAKEITPVVANDPNGPAFKFKEETWDFGSIPQGTPVTHVFNFDNAGKEPLVISQATASCGCTTPEWTKEPVLEGKSGAVKVTFNAAKEGQFTKNSNDLIQCRNSKVPDYKRYSDSCSKTD